MKLLVSERSLFAGLAFPNKRSLVATPGLKMSIETVVRDIDLAADKPLGVWRMPVQNRVPLLKPMKLFSHARPEACRVSTRFDAQTLELLHRVDMGF